MSLGNPGLGSYFNCAVRMDGTSDLLGRANGRWKSRRLEPSSRSVPLMAPHAPRGAIGNRNDLVLGLHDDRSATRRTFTAVSVGTDTDNTFACAIATSGSVECWGDDDRR